MRKTDVNRELTNGNKILLKKEKKKIKPAARGNMHLKGEVSSKKSVSDIILIQQHDTSRFS